MSYTYISLLRGINIAGQKKILMKDLRDMYEKLGFIDVVSYIQSGNVILRSPETSQSKLAQMIKDQIQVKYGFEVEVLIITPDYLRGVIQSDPFQKESMYITYLFEKPSDLKLDIIAEKTKPGEEVRVIGSAVYFYCPDGYYGTKISTNLFEKIFETKATMRNMRTSKKLLELTQ